VCEQKKAEEAKKAAEKAKDNAKVRRKTPLQTRGSSLKTGEAHTEGASRLREERTSIEILVHVPV
jgi:hypothetical protein